MDLTQQKIDTLNLPIRRKHIRLELLNDELKTIDLLEGIAINGSLSKNANDILRRSGNITIAIPIDKSQITFLDSIDYESINYNGKIWIDKMIKIFVGIENNYNDIDWYNFGICIIDSPSRIINGNQYEISFNLIDYFAKFTGNRNGQLTTLSTNILQGYYEEKSDGEKEYIRTKTKDALKSVIVEIADIKKYSIRNIPNKYEYLPRDISVDGGGTIYDIFSQFLDILNTWQMYFDNDGIFIVEPIPSGVNDFAFPLEYNHFISDELSSDFSNIKNQIIIYGRLNTLTFYTENVTYNSTELILKYDTIDTSACITNATLFGFKTKEIYNNIELQRIKIYNGNNILIQNQKLINFEDEKIENDKSGLPTEFLQPNEIYALRINKADKLTNEGYVDFSSSLIFEFFSKQQASYCLVNDNRDSPFYINKNIDEKYSYYCGLSYGIGKDYLLTTDNITILNEIEDKTILTFISNYNNKENPTISVRNIDKMILLRNVPIVQNSWFSNGNNNYIRKPILPNKISNDYTIWKVQYEKDNNCFVLLGKNEKALTLVLNGGDYDNIYNDRLAYERCRYEMYLHSNMNNNIKLGVFPNYLLDVNFKIEYDEEKSLPLNYTNTHNFIVKDNLGLNTEIFLTKDSTLGNFQTFSIEQETKRYYLVKNITYPLGIDNVNQNIEAIEIYNDKNYIGSEYD